MSIIEIIDVFVFYGLDVIALAFATAVIVQVLKKTALKNMQNKLYTFLPFIIGTFLYAVYETIYHLDWQYCFLNLVSVLEYGISVGALATLFYVLYEQFIRESNDLSATENVIAELIAGYVPDENIEDAAKLIAEAIEGNLTDSGAEAAAQILKDNSPGTASDDNLQILAKLIIRTLATFSVS